MIGINEIPFVTWNSELGMWLGEFKLIGEEKCPYFYSYPGKVSVSVISVNT